METFRPVLELSCLQGIISMRIFFTRVAVHRLKALLTSQFNLVMAVQALLQRLIRSTISIIMLVSTETFITSLTHAKRMAYQLQEEVHQVRMPYCIRLQQ